MLTVFSIEWSRIEPEEGKFDEKEIEHYRQVILALRKRGLSLLWGFGIGLILCGSRIRAAGNQKKLLNIFPDMPKRLFLAWEIM